MLTTNTPKEANQALYISVRSAFIAQGTSLNAWCLENDLHLQNVRAAFMGSWRGEKASRLVDRVVAASGVTRP